MAASAATSAQLAEAILASLPEKRWHSILEATLGGDILFDGDSLIRFAISILRRDEESLPHLPEPNSPAPLLSLVYAIETLLASFSKLGHELHIFFTDTFDGVAPLTVGRFVPAYRSLRSAIRSHLSRIPSLTIHSITNVFAEDFHNLIEDVQASAVVLQFDPTCPASSLGEDEQSRYHTASLITARRILCAPERQITVILLDKPSHGHPIGIDFSSIHPTGSVYVPTPSAVAFVADPLQASCIAFLSTLDTARTAARPSLTELAAAVVAELPGTASSKDSNLTTAHVQRLAANVPAIAAVAAPAAVIALVNERPEHTRGALRAVVSAVISVLTAAGETQLPLVAGTAQALILHTVIAAALPIRARVFPDSQWSATDSLLAEFILSATDSSLAAALKSVAGTEAYNVCDAIDGRLLRVVLNAIRGLPASGTFSSVCTALIKDPAAAETTAKIWKAVCATFPAGGAIADKNVLAGISTLPRRSAPPAVAGTPLFAFEDKLPENDYSKACFQPEFLVPAEDIIPADLPLVVGNGTLGGDRSLLEQMVDRFDVIVGRYRDVSTLTEMKKLRIMQKHHTSLGVVVTSLLGQSFFKVKIRWHDATGAEGRYACVFCDSNDKEVAAQASLETVDRSEGRSERQLKINHTFDTAHKQLAGFEQQLFNLSQGSQEHVRYPNVPTIMMPSEMEIREAFGEGDHLKKLLDSRLVLLADVRSFQHKMVEKKMESEFSNWRKIVREMQSKRTPVPVPGDVRHPEAIAAYELWKAVLEALNVLWPDFVANINSNTISTWVPESSIEPEVLKLLITACFELGFADVVGDELLRLGVLSDAQRHNIIYYRNHAVPISRASLRFLPTAADSKLRAGSCSVAEFYLSLVGPELPRPRGQAQDALVRVPFSPDLWQVNLLDAVDANKSACVIAPTSAGKTFIAHYLVRKTLMDVDEGIVIYVGPIEALVMQFRNEVDTLYSKEYKDGDSSKKIVGYYTGEEREFELNSQVLTTLPGSFEQLLTAISNAGWMSKIKAIIFDEVHNMFDTTSMASASWERLLLVTSAQFIALSATVGESSRFEEWLASLEKKRRNAEVVFIRHTERYNDLAPFVWSRAHTDRTADTFMPLHPLLGLQSKLFPLLPWLRPDLVRADPALDPPECRSQRLDIPVLPEHAAPLYRTLDEQVRALPPSDFRTELIAELELLLPARFFQPCEVVSLRVARRYALALFGVLRRLHSHEATAAQAVSASLVAPSERLAAQVTKTVDDNARRGTARYFYTHILQFLQDLDSTNRTPAILFHLDKDRCCKLQRFITKLLYVRESIFKRDSGWWENRERRLAEIETRLEQLQVVKDRRKFTPDEEVEYTTIRREKRTLDEMTEDDMLPAFMIGRKTDSGEGHKPINAEVMYTALKFRESKVAEMLGAEFKEMKDEIDLARSTILQRKRKAALESGNQAIALGDESGLKASWEDVEAYLVEQGGEDELAKPFWIMGFKRGISVHHDSMLRKHRDGVETLFRLKELSVIISTATLGQGVNLPCRCVGFIGESAQLTPLTYRQMSGRAGRRGFDKRGDVVFFGVRTPFLKRLFMSQLDTPTTLLPVTLPSMLGLIARRYGSFDATNTKFVSEKGSEVEVILSSVPETLKVLKALDQAADFIALLPNAQRIVDALPGISQLSTALPTADRLQKALATAEKLAKLFTDAIGLATAVSSVAGPLQALVDAQEKLKTIAGADKVATALPAAAPLLTPAHRLTGIIASLNQGAEYLTNILKAKGPLKRFVTSVTASEQLFKTINNAAPLLKGMPESDKLKTAQPGIKILQEALVKTTPEAQLEALCRPLGVLEALGEAGKLIRSLPEVARLGTALGDTGKLAVQIDSANAILEALPEAAQVLSTLPQGDDLLVACLNAFTELKPLAGAETALLKALRDSPAAVSGFAEGSQLLKALGALEKLPNTLNQGEACLKALQAASEFRAEFLSSFTPAQTVTGQLAQVIQLKPALPEVGHLFKALPAVKPLLKAMSDPDKLLRALPEAQKLLRSQPEAFRLLQALPRLLNDSFTIKYNPAQKAQIELLGRFFFRHMHNRQLLNPEGIPRALAGLPVYLADEPALSLDRLIRSGALVSAIEAAYADTATRGIAAEAAFRTPVLTSEHERFARADNALLNILSCLVGHVRLPSHTTRNHVSIRNLPRAIQDVLRNDVKATLTAFVQEARAFNSRTTQSDIALPLSSWQQLPTTGTAALPSDTSVHLRSALHALRGANDQFATFEELLSSSEFLPSLRAEHLPALVDLDALWSNFPVQFYQTGDDAVVASDLCMSREHVLLNVLRNFTVLLRNIATAAAREFHSAFCSLRETPAAAPAPVAPVVPAPAPAPAPTSSDGLPQFEAAWDDEEFDIGMPETTAAVVTTDTSSQVETAEQRRLATLAAAHVLPPALAKLIDMDGIGAEGEREDEDDVVKAEAPIEEDLPESAAAEVPAIKAEAIASAQHQGYTSRNHMLTDSAAFLPAGFERSALLKRIVDGVERITDAEQLMFVTTTALLGLHRRFARVLKVVHTKLKQSQGSAM